jgi:hypothetical protein
MAASYRTWRPDSTPSPPPGEDRLTVVAQIQPPNPDMPRHVAKFEIAQSVARGETSLLTAAGLFRDLSPDQPVQVRRLRNVPPECTDEELFARNVIAHVQSLLRDRPAEREAVVRRLEAELECRLAENTLSLSGFPPV